MGREVLLVGSVPLRPAAAVFETVSDALGSLLRRMPDGDQNGWILAVLRSLAANETLERTGQVELSRNGAVVPTFGPRTGMAADLRLGPYGYAETAAESYETFKKLRTADVVPHATRFQVTLPGPGTSAFMVDAPATDLFPAAREALARELEAIAAAVPASELAVQIDLAMEAEHEEYRRRPDAFDTPVHDTFDWTLEQMADSAAWLSDRVPAEAELGFHICSIWHHYQAAGQDNAVLVDTANALAARIRRRIDYIHLPVIPEHTDLDFKPFGDLKLPSETTVFLGVIHRKDGAKGLRRRIAAAQAVLPDFGVASFCGLGIPTTSSDVKVGESLHEDLRNEGAALNELLALHRIAAEI